MCRAGKSADGEQTGVTGEGDRGGRRRAVRSNCLLGMGFPPGVMNKLWN